jgi:3-oxoacyl-[acyl-carrier protein] reductase
MTFFSLKGRSAVVTGAARGIGRAIADRFAAAGADVLIADIDKEAADKAAAEISGKAGARTASSKTNIAVWDDCKAMADSAVKAFGKLDILVNCAAIAGKDDFIWDMPVEEFRKVVEIDLVGLWQCCKACIVPMRERKYGRIINIASVAGKEGNPRMMAYSAAKAGAIGMTKSLAKEVCKEGICVNAVTPAVIRTPMLEQLTAEQVKYMTDKIPMGRVGEVHEVAALCHFLASDECSFSTGASFDISGGRTTY